MAASIGGAWANAYAVELRTQRRAVSGGWPGTMTEARARVLAHVGGAAAMPVGDLQALARATYRAAQDAWRHVAVPDTDEEHDD